MTDEQIERLIKTLERIAYALEIANVPNAYVIPTTPSSGYQCQKCWQWVPTGMFHTCVLSGGGNTSSYQCCNEYGPNGGRCYLNKDHSSDHVFAIVTNDNG